MPLVTGLLPLWCKVLGIWKLNYRFPYTQILCESALLIAMSFSQRQLRMFSEHNILFLFCSCSVLCSFTLLCSFFSLSCLVLPYSVLLFHSVPYNPIPSCPVTNCPILFVSPGPTLHVHPHRWTGAPSDFNTYLQSHLLHSKHASAQTGPFHTRCLLHLLMVIFAYKG